MAALMFVLAILAGLIGAAIFSAATSAIQEGVAGLFWVMAAVLLGAAGVINAIDKAVSEIRRAAKPKPSGQQPELDKDSPSGEKPLG